LRKLKLLAALLAMMMVIASSTVSPAMADHWDYYEDPWGECGWIEVWEWSEVFEDWDFEGYEYNCHEDYWDGPYGYSYGPYESPWGLDYYDDGPYDRGDGPYEDGPYDRDDGPYEDGPYDWD
jgi:hypothetical protein